MKISLGCAALLLGLASGAEADFVKPEQLVRYCNAIMLQDAGTGGEAPYDTGKRLFPAALRYFNSLSSTEKRHQLMVAQKLPLGWAARQSVAYVAAKTGIEPFQNTRRMLAYNLRILPHERLAELIGFESNNYVLIKDIYQRQPDRRIALLLLEAYPDGPAGEVAQDVRFELLKDQPRFVLALTMQSKRAFSRMAYDFCGDVGEDRLRVLRRLCHDRDPILRSGARQLRRRFHAFRSHNLRRSHSR